MVFKLKTSKETMDYFEEINLSLHLQPFILSKLAIALSLKKPFETLEFNKDNDGLELNRQTITGEYDELFKALIIQNANIPLPDETYFPKYLKAHIDRGAKLLYSEFKYNNTNFYLHLIELEKGI